LRKALANIEITTDLDKKKLECRIATDAKVIPS
jgi:hypothetical protein